MNKKKLNIKNKVLIIAEIGNNHEGSFSLAKKLNTQFKTEKFSVVLLHKGEQVYPNAK